MSLLDDVSIVVTPNGYKAGELYAVVPTEVEGTELLTNEDFTNGLTGWGTQIPSGQTVEVTSNQLHINYDSTETQGLTGVYQSILTSGKRYTTTIDVVSVTGTFKVQVGSVSHYITTSGIKTFTNIASNSTIYVVRKSNSTSFEATINSVSVKEITGADMDVTRATAATRVDEDGLVNYAEVLGSEEVSDGDFLLTGTQAENTTGTYWTTGIGWTIANSKAECDGTQTTFSYLSQLGLGLSDKTYKIKFSVTRSSGTLRPQFVGGTSGVSASDITSSGDYTIYIQPVDNTTFRFRANSSFVGDVSDISIKEADRDNVPRIDYTGGGCPHILAEPMRTNLVTYSEAFSNWNTSSGVVVTDNTTELISPSGDYNASKIEYNGSNKNLFQAPTLSGVYSGYFYVKGTIGETIRMSVGGVEENFTLTGDWDKIKKENVTAIANTFNINTFGGATATTIYLWGGQVEQGSYATSYIPTSGSTVTRNQDIFTRDGIGSLINSEEGVLFVEMAALSDDSTDRRITMSDGTTQNRMAIGFDNASNKIKYFLISSNTIQVNKDISVSNITQFNKIAFKYKLNDFALWVNGVEVDTDTSGSTFSANTLSVLRFAGYLGTSQNFYGKVKQLQVFKTALSDSELATLTT